MTAVAHDDRTHRRFAAGVGRRAGGRERLAHQASSRCPRGGIFDVVTGAGADG